MSDPILDTAVADSQNAEDLPSGDGGLSQATDSRGGSADHGKLSEKTISCISCRRRKLKCDRVKPRCGTCTRLKQTCEFPQRRRNLGAKRRSMKELEARLAQVETQLVVESKTASAETQPTSGTNVEADWNTLGLDMNIDIQDGDMLGSFDISQSNLTFPTDSDMFSQELISLGLQEPLPPQDMIDELHEIYFKKYHKTIPMVHKYRYYAALDKPVNLRPPICFRYALWMMAASTSEKHRAYEDILYERARRYLQIDEMKGRGEAFVSLAHAQTWGLISHYEAKNTLFSRSWMSTGRMVRMVQMLGLNRIDSGEVDGKRILPPARDRIELEERRRTFWCAYYGDRWASTGTGWPMLIQEDEISTNLPVSEEAFESGTIEIGTSLEDALTSEGSSKLSKYGGVILSAALYGRNFQHLQKSGPKSRPGDLSGGDFWLRHRKMDNILLNTFMFLPDHLRLPDGIRDMNIVFMHMNLHSSVICLHRAAILTGSHNNVDPGVIRQSRSRCLMAAEEIANIMRLVCHGDISEMNAWVGFCLYVAGGVFLRDAKDSPSNSQSRTNLDFILSAMRAIGLYHTVTNHFTTQLELDVEAAGFGAKEKLATQIVPNVPINGILPERDGLPMTVENLKHLFAAADATANVAPVNKAFNSSTDAVYEPITCQYWSPPPESERRESTDPSSGGSPNHDMNNFKVSDLYIFKQTAAGESIAQGQNSVSATGSGAPRQSLADPNVQSNAHRASMMLDGVLPSKDSSRGPSASTMEFPYRQATSSTANTSAVQGVPVPAILDDYELPPEWSIPQDFTFS